MVSRLLTRIEDEAKTYDQCDATNKLQERYKKFGPSVVLERARDNRARHRAFQNLQKNNARSHFWNAQSNFWNAGSAVELPLRRDLTKADRSISCGSCNVFCAC